MSDLAKLYRPALALTLLGLAACVEQTTTTATPEASAESAAPLAISAQDPSLQWGPCPDIFPAGCEITVLRGDPAQPNADVFLRAPGGYNFPAHSHTSAERMILVSGQMRVRYEGAPEALLNAGQYAFGPAGLPHDASCLSADPCTLFIAFVGPVDAMAHDGPIGAAPQ